MPRPQDARGKLTEFERLIASLSARFINLPAGEVNDAFRESLREIVLFMGIDRSSVTRFAPDSAFYRTQHSWAVPGVAPLSYSSTTRHFPWVYAQAMAGKPIVFSRLEDLPPEASADRESYRGFGLRSHVGQPIVVAGRLYGVLGFGCLRSERTWSADDLERTHLLATIFAHALARVAAQEEVDRAVGFERLASSILASLVVTTPGDEGAAVAEILQRIGAFMGAERVTLWERVPDKAEFRRSTAWRVTASPVAPDVDAPSPPWIASRLCAGHAVHFCEFSELPPAAAADIPLLRAAHIRSLLVVPVALRGEVVGAFATSTISSPREWPAGMVSGARLLTEVFAALRERSAIEYRKQAAEVEAALWRERLAHLVRVHTAGEMSVALAHEITQPLGAIENYALAARRRASDRRRIWRASWTSRQDRGPGHACGRRRVADAQHGAAARPRVEGDRHHTSSRRVRRHGEGRLRAARHPRCRARHCAQRRGGRRRDPPPAGHPEPPAQRDGGTGWRRPRKRRKEIRIDIAPSGAHDVSVQVGGSRARHCRRRSRARIRVVLLDQDSGPRGRARRSAGA